MRLIIIGGFYTTAGAGFKYFLVFLRFGFLEVRLCLACDFFFCIDEWLVRLVQSMYKDVRSRVRVGDGYSEEFGVGVGVHQGSVLSPLHFIIVLEALSREFRTGCPWELLYADDLMISAGSMEELLVKVKTWKTEMEKKGLRVNMGKKR